MLDCTEDRPTPDLGLAAVTSRETGQGDGVRVVRREGGCSAGLSPAETHQVATIRALVSSMRPRYSLVMMDCAGRHIEGYNWGKLSCSSASADQAASLAVHAAPGAVCTARSSRHGKHVLKQQRVPRDGTCGFDLFVTLLCELLTSRAHSAQCRLPGGWLRSPFRTRGISPRRQRHRHDQLATNRAR